jgi:hypothetical protein
MIPVRACDCPCQSERIGNKGAHDAAAILASDWEEDDSGKSIDAMIVGQNFDDKNAVIPNG